MTEENLFAALRGIVLSALEELAPGLAPEVLARVEVTPTKDPAHGDMASNAAMIAAKPAGKAPRDLAAALVERLLAQPGIAKAEAAGPGFVNLTLAPELLLAQVPVILGAGEAYGQSRAARGKINVEYVSANPTGPLHVGHCRGAVVGDALANLLAKAGYDVTKEYYINDAGAQVIALARSVYVRYLEALKLSPEAYIETVPGGMQYGGAYLIPIGEALAEKYGDEFAETPEAHWLDVFRDFAVARMMELIREDLAALGVVHDVFSSERALVENGGVALKLQTLRDQGLIYRGILEPPKGKTPDDWEPREQELFRATEFGDDVDRPIAKSDGSFTYFANDAAYHADKIARGFHAMIDVWGADHGGYVKRMQAAVKALSGGHPARLDVVLCQIVKVLKDGEPVKMSKRAGTFVELRDLIDEVGPDAVRFLMLMRKSDAQMDFDLNAAVAQTRDNPVFYVQYAHARCRSVLRAAPAVEARADLSSLTAPEEQAMLRRLITWPRLVEQAAESREPHRVAFFLYDLAADFHALWNAGRDNAALRFLQEDKPAETAARVALVAATAIVLRSGLAVLGVKPVEEMR
ncbi:arginine--tRNA ligase [Acidocella sp. KAb 2-4]|uniref:arginine--tRNA ligase n=1 Tax=Acidocella sp. KAb 2-4 TaxID=2885158 RepID=UPI001D06243E|nr:arginine--tRNA ligase [Acidocella sp. KAb 2-4]MCB5945360.1 arginine--tRNA ligase [Acidocella sp. KAb 2-4]